MKRIYVAGSMTAHKDTDWGWGHFEREATKLRAQGHIVVSPAEVDLAVWGFNGQIHKEMLPGMTYKKCLCMDVGFLLPSCDAIYLLKGWSQSRGALAELAVAIAYGLEIMYEPGAERGTVGFIAEGEL